MIWNVSLRSPAVLAAAVALLSVWVWPFQSMAHHSFSIHMMQHVVAMNVAAPLLAFALAGTWRLPLGIIAVLQMAGLWFWHLPAVYMAAHHSPVLGVAMQASLFAAALLFWSALFSRPAAKVWGSLSALLITAKVFCFLGAVFIFARRGVYGQMVSFDDQQLAGLIMVTTCALIYIAAAIALFARWLFADRNVMTHDAAITAR